MKEIRLLLRYAAKYWYRYVIGIVALLVVDAVNTRIPVMTGQITDGLAARNMPAQMVTGLVMTILLMGLTIAVGRFFWRIGIFGAARSIERDIRGDLFRHIEQLDAEWLNSHKTGDLMAYFTNDLQSVRAMMGMNVIATIDASVMMLLVLYNMISFVSPKLTAVVIIPLIIIIFGDAWYAKAEHRRFLERQTAFSQLSDMTQEAVSGIRVIKAFVQEKKQQYAFALECLNNKEKNMAVVRLQALFMPTLDLIVGLSMLLTLMYGGYLTIMGEITVGGFVAFNSYVTMLVWPMIAAGECVTGMSQGMASMKRITSILTASSEITDAQADSRITSIHGEIDLHDLTFRYPGSEIPAVDHVSVHVPCGSTLAIIGRTGSGKSTIVSLLSRLYDVVPGMIHIDGHDIREIPLAVLRSQIACVPQDSFLFSDTISGNIAFAVDEWKQEEVEAAAEMACVHDNIIEFPEGYNTVVGERGVTLSGGQKQRSSIARALMANAPVLVLDDSLSAVDTDTEEKILQNLKRERAGKTTIIIAHRISTIQHADNILVLDEGRVVEHGNHEQLMERHGLYRSIWEKQQLEKQLGEEGGEDE